LDFFWISLDFQWFLLGFGWKLKKINEILRKSLPAELPQPVFQTSRKPQTNQFPKQSNSIMKKTMKNIFLFIPIWKKNRF